MIKYKLTPEAQAYEDSHQIDFTPTRATTGSNGFDLRACSATDIVIPPREIVKVKLGVHIWIGEEVVDRLNVKGDSFKLAGLLLSRSSNKDIVLNNCVGLTDTDFQGELFAKVFNKSEEDTAIIKPFEKFVQLIIVPTYIEAMHRVNEFRETTVRGQGGDGSTNQGNIPLRDKDGYYIPPAHIVLQQEGLLSSIFFNEADEHVFTVLNVNRKEPDWFLEF